MTAINVLIGYGETHLFADTGHYSDFTQKLDHLAPKVFPIERHKCLLAWSGPSSLGPKLANICNEYKGDLFLIFPDLVKSLRVLQRFSAILVTAGSGITIEENNKIHRLGPGSVVRSISTLVQIDPNDIKGSGVRLMEAQRQSSGVVFGQCQYWKLDNYSCTMEILKDWNDQPAKIKSIPIETLAAKIGDLEVGQLKLKNNAVTKIFSASGTSSGLQVTTSNSGSFPNIVSASLDLKYTGGNSGSSGDIDATITRTNDSTMIDTQHFGFTGSSTGSYWILNLFGLDVGMGSNRTYRLTWLINTVQGAITIQAGNIKAFHSVK